MKVNLITQRSNQNPTENYNVIEEDASSAFDSESSDSSSFDNEFSNAGGVKKLMKNFRKNQKIRQKRKDLNAKTRNTQAKAQIESAKAMQKGVAGDVAMAKALEANALPVEPPKKSNTMLYVGIASAVLILGIVGFIMYKKSKGKKVGK
jgi:hypothetical protein